MKSVHYFFIFFSLVNMSIHAQTVNWNRLENEPTHIVNVNAGLQHGVIYGVDYSYYSNLHVPILFHLSISIPSGKKLTDDFKIQPGIQIQWLKKSDFKLITNIDGISRRRHETTTVSLFNLGAGISASFGYYRPGWLIAVEAGFDKAIATKFKHSQAYRDNYPEVQDGWYKHSTGGNFNYGLKTGISFGKQDIYLQVGKIIAQDFRSKPQVPFYGQIGYTMRLSNIDKSEQK